MLPPVPRSCVEHAILRSRFLSRERIIQKSALLAALRTEIHRHDFSHFVDNPGRSPKAERRRGCELSYVNLLRSFADLPNKSSPIGGPQNTAGCQGGEAPRRSLF
jgi:hypothetical protein